MGIIDIFNQWFGVYLHIINQSFKLFLNDMPMIFGLRLGYWFIIIGFFTLLCRWLLNYD